MGYTAPRTWVAGEVVTHTLMNTHVRDNLLALSEIARTWTYAQTFNDDVDIKFGTGADAVIRWSDADSSNHALSVGLGDSNQAFHITDLGAIATDWNIAATTHPNVYIHSNTTPATDYLRLGGHTGTTADIDVVGGTTLNLQIAGATEVSLTASKLDVASGTQLDASDTTASTSTTTGAFITAGGIGVALASTFGGDVEIENGFGLVIGHTAQLTDVAGVAWETQILGTGYEDSGLLIGSYSTTAGISGSLRFVRGRGSIGAVTTVVDDDTLLVISGHGEDGTAAPSAAGDILLQVDGTPGNNDMPGRWLFRTTADGASSPTSRLSIDSTGQVHIDAETGSTSSTTGALIVDGGVGIAENLHVGSGFGMPTGTAVSWGGNAPTRAVAMLQIVDVALIDTDGGNAATGINIDVRGAAESGTTAGLIRGVSVFPRLHANNANNMTAPVGIRGVTVAPSFLSGSSGTVTGTAGFHYSNLTDSSSAVATNQYGLYVEALSSATNNYGIWIESGDIVLDDDSAGGRIYFGEGQDAYLDYNGTNLNINTAAVGSGGLDISGVIAIGSAGTPLSTTMIAASHSVSAALADGTDGFGINAQIAAFRTANSTAQTIGVKSTVQVAASNTHNHTNTVGIAAFSTSWATLGGGSGTVTGAAGIYIASGAVVGAAVTNQYGIYIADQTAASNDYGIYIAGADTYAIWVDADTCRFDGKIEARGDIGDNSTRVVKLWATDIDTTNSVVVSSSLNSKIESSVKSYTRSAIDIVNDIRVVEFQHLQGIDRSGRTKLGVIAESISEPLATPSKHYVTHDEEGGLDEDLGDAPGVDILALIALNTKAIQELSRSMADRTQHNGSK